MKSFLCFSVLIPFFFSQRIDRQAMKDVGEIVFETKFIPPGSSKVQTLPGHKIDPVSGQLVVRCVEGKNLNGNDMSNPFCEL